MTDIFLSYASQDRARISAFRKLLIDEGFDVFWDQDIPLGANWDEYIREKLSAAWAVVVFWSANAITSDSVIHEASIAKNRSILIPVLIDQIEPSKFPLGHYSVQALLLLSSIPTREHIQPILTVIESRLMRPWMRRKMQEMEKALNSNIKIVEEYENQEQTLRNTIQRLTKKINKFKYDADNPKETEISPDNSAHQITNSRYILNSIASYIESNNHQIDARTSFLRFTVNAFSLENPFNEDEVTIEYAIKNPVDSSIVGLIQPLTQGDGQFVAVSVSVAVDTESGSQVGMEQFIIDGMKSGIPGETSKIVILLRDHHKLFGRSIFIVKKERRRDFMKPLGDKKSDYLAIRNLYFPTDEMIIQLNVPPNFPKIQSDWALIPPSPNSPSTEAKADETVRPEVIIGSPIRTPLAYRSYAARVQNCGVGSRMRGTFTVES